MTPTELSDAQWCFLDLLMRAREKGVGRLNRLELFKADNLPEHALLKFVWAGLELANTDFVDMPTEHDFEITDAGVQIFNLRFNRPPTKVADHVIALGYQGDPS